jgi:putative membrane-bound dehydrogenase-like protein
MRRAILVLFLAATSIHAQQPPQKGAGPGKPLSPQEAQKLFKLDDCLRIELVACEPQIESPVAMAFDPDGRLWVVEMRDYPNGPGKGQPPQGRIRILEDRDGDGFFETSTIWADHLLFANGLFLWKDGAIVTMAPKITHLRDTKATGKADTEDILYTGFAEQNPQLRVSHPILGLDGWIYCANGLRGGKVTIFDRAGVKHKVVDLSGMDFRFDPVTRDYEAITGPGQFGNAFDEWGNRFICDNRHHLRHVVMENRYVKRNPYLAAPSLVEDISVLEDGPLNSGGRVYPISKNWTTSSLHEGRFTAACGVFIYNGELLDHASLPRKRGEDAALKTPPAHAGGSQNAVYHGAAFTCEPTGNLVHMELLTPKGATFEAKPHRKGVEFLATPDDWCRPVFLTHGPEGAMYVVDMYRAVIEHPEWMPPELRNRPDLWDGKDRGRIWRIVPKDHKTKTPRPNLSKASIAELVKTLEHAEPWWRTTAQRLLLEKNDKAMIEPLTKLLEETKSPHAKILAGWLLDRQVKLTLSMILKMIDDASPFVKQHGFRLIEPRLQNMARHDALKFVSDLPDLNEPDVGSDLRVNFQRALAVGIIEDNYAGDIGMDLAKVVFLGSKDRWTRLAVQCTHPKNAVSVLFWTTRMTSGKRYPDYPIVLRQQASLVAVQKDPKTFVEALHGFGDEIAGFAGLAEGLYRRGTNLTEVVNELPDDEKKRYIKGLNDVIATASQKLRDSSNPIEERSKCLIIISQAPWSIAKERLLPVVEKENDVQLRIAALRALATQQDKEVPAFLMKLWPGAAPSLRREILEAMLRQPARVNVLLDEIEAKRLRASELDPSRTRQLTTHKDAGIRARARKLLANNLPADRANVLVEYQAALTMKGDGTNGRAIFTKNCATCHRVAGIGIDVGPDIADTRTKTLGALLNDIIAPNAAIDANYVNYVVTTKDGRILTGLLTAESASSITLVRAEKQMDVVLRKDVDEIASTGISLMPEGFEKHISVREMADLLHFLKNWRYLDGSVPTGN